MIKTLRKSAKTEDEAIKAALAELGVERDDVSIQIVERAKSGFLGFGAAPAVIEVTYEAPDEKPTAIPSAEARIEADRNQHTKKRRETESTANSEAPRKKTEAAPERILKDTSKPSDYHADKHNSDKQGPSTHNEREAAEAVPDEHLTALTEKVQGYLGGLIERIGFSGTIKAGAGKDGEIEVIIESEDAGSIIGRRGETLEAIQALTNYTVNKGLRRRVRITIDTEGYRQRREETLIGVAERTAAKVLKYRRNITLEPMNAYERHVIHAALQEYDGVATHSVGSEPNRRIVVTCERVGFTEPGRFAAQADAEARPPHRDGGHSDHRRNGNRNRNRSGGERAPSAPRPEPADIEAYSAESNTNYREWK